MIRFGALIDIEPGSFSNLNYMAINITIIL